MDMFYYGLFLVWGIVLLIGLLIGVAFWVFRSLSVYQIAKRRGIRNAWLSWIPVGYQWIVGSISDQYQYLVHGKIHHRRKFLLGFSLAAWVGLVTSIVWLVVVTTNYMMQYAYYYSHWGYSSFNYGDMASAIGLSVVLVLSVIVVIVDFIFQCICKYDLYRSCDQNNAVAYLVLGIVFVVLDPIFLWLCRNKDEGMPPRKPENQTFAESGDPTYL